MSNPPSVLVIGAGIIGISVAYYLSRRHGITQITLIDKGQPMEFTSAQSGENYRNWWPHPTMVAFTDHSIDLMEEIARESGNAINMTRRGYALATRETEITPLLADLRAGLGEDAETLLRHHDRPSSRSYQPAHSAAWTEAPVGVDILQNPVLIKMHFPSYDPDVATVLHIRRGGDISGQQLGAHMLRHLATRGVRPRMGRLTGLQRGDGYRAEIDTGQGIEVLEADLLVNAAGPFAGQVARMLDVDLPLTNVLQQKIAFEDRLRAIPRQMPFSIDLDAQTIDWSPEDRALLAESAETARFAGLMPGAIHCRPDGGDGGSWVKLGWAYNECAEAPNWEPRLHDAFPEIVLRGAARLNPALMAYYGRLPPAMLHYGGWYTMTPENWPLIGPIGPEGAFMAAGLSGFGTMAACATGALVADWVAEAPLPAYATHLSAERYRDDALMTALRAANRGVL